MKAVRDPELLKEAAKAKLEINPGSGEDLERNVKELLRLDPPIVARLKEILNRREKCRASAFALHLQIRKKSRRCPLRNCHISRFQRHCQEESTVYSAGISEGGKKYIVADPKLAHRVVLLDPDAATAPGRLLAASGMNALAHCVEAVYSTETQPLTDAYCLRGIGLIVRYLPRAVENSRDLEALSYVQVAACLSGMGVYSAWTGIHHAIVHVVGGCYKAPHAEIHALMLPYAMRWNLDATVGAHARMAREMGIEGADENALAAAVPEHVFAMNQRMRLPLRLRGLGVPRDGLRQLVSDALDDYSIHTNPKPVTAAEQVLEVLEQAW